MSEWTDDFGKKLNNVHEREDCARIYCTIHNPSKHSMSEFKQSWRDDRGFMERVCPHGVGHPDPDDINADPMHGCDGCCTKDKGQKVKIKAKKQEPKKQYTRELTLDEYDELTMENQILGAGIERGKIVEELERRAAQLRAFSEAADLVPNWDLFAQHARGMEMAVRIVRGLRKYEDNVGCPECEAF